MKSLSPILLLNIGFLFAVSALAKEITIEELNSEWRFYGLGQKKVERGMFYMKEVPESQGVMIVSPCSYDGDVTIQYEVMPLTAASVCVAIMAASDPGNAESLTIPENYDGSMGLWINHIENFLFGFHNASHNRTPFAIKFPERKLIAESEKNVMSVGKFHLIEMGRQGDKLWLSIDGETIFEAHDEKIHQGGHVAFRIRGLTHETASCLIRNVRIDWSQERK